MGQDNSVPEEPEITFELTPNGKWIETSADELINIDNVLTISKRRCIQDDEEMMKIALILVDRAQDGCYRYVSSPVSAEQALAFQDKLAGRKRKR